ncbi:cyclin-dependent kinase inhibitor 3 [Columba livia]|uniref:Cyclin-dependent kinase inhibitor 3 n=1 Tax=Columba livia TaxID=8932 RepID=A0A2I0LUG2_COLLI|nr:cyclin-dependent kinase inhibitor 3 [Columba livia]
MSPAETPLQPQRPQKPHYLHKAAGAGSPGSSQPGAGRPQVSSWLLSRRRPARRQWETLTLRMKRTLSGTRGRCPSPG